MYDYQWTTEILTPTFSHYRWSNQPAGIITYIGDQVKFQNSFGAWLRMVYECDYATVGGNVVDLRMRRGRF